MNVRLTNALEAVKLAYYDQEQLRLLHNSKGKELDGRLISPAQWRDFKRNWQKQHIACCTKLLKVRGELLNHKIYSLQPSTDAIVKYPESIVSDGSKYHYNLLLLNGLFDGTKDEGIRLKASASRELSRFKDKFKSGDV